MNSSMKTASEAGLGRRSASRVARGMSAGTLAAASLACAAPAFATIIDSGVIDVSVQTNGGEQYANVPIGATGGHLQISFFPAGKDPAELNLSGGGLSEQFAATVQTGQMLTPVSAGVEVGPSPAIGAFEASDAYVDPADFSGPDGAYFAFEFLQGGVLSSQTYSGPVDYGYGVLDVSGSTYTLVRYVYDDTGAPITIPAASSAPEPESWTLMLVGVGAMGAMLSHRRARRLATL